ncbi:hypothetical protein MAR_ORF208 [Marseillevirus marseillevirus]|uniref:Uncharacterized protein n=1 Tax=Marseillevirus marseillevirus TaxID=694581 RepID=D2XAL0_GBMV|nr:hypothetical protein MAR_ORF208 [Marseillevirus marseillevirus]YP_009094687.1 hypothetical protein MEL_186 [Melbournevirus]ADB03987.1 hypothetical protein MAR_ORF208 [Marseillevirus marseillevirus]AIT54799.1 hypothetical protein MEL_186 [Melbournevirus]
MSSYIKQIESISGELKRLSERSKDLRERKKGLEAKLLDFMDKRSIEEFQGYKRKKLEPKQRVPRLKKKEKDEIRLRMLEEVGLPDPRGFLEQMLKAESGRQ